MTADPQRDSQAGAPPPAPGPLPGGALPRRREWLAVWGLWLVFVLRAATYVSITPLWEGFDEHVHFAYAQHIAEQGRFPLLHQDTVSKEVRQSLENMPLPREPKGFGVGRVHDDWWKMTAAQREDALRKAVDAPPEWRAQPSPAGPGHLGIYQAHHGPLYYALAAIPYRAFSQGNIIVRVFALRFFSILLASVVVFAGYFTFRQVFGDRSLALVLTAVLVFMPGLMTDTCRVGNDSLSISLLSLAIALAVKDPPWTWRRTILLSLVAAAGLLTKAYFLSLLPAFIGILGAVFLRRPRRCRAFCAHAAVFLALVAAMSAWWFIRNYQLYGSLSGMLLEVAHRRISMTDVALHTLTMNWRQTLETTLFSHIWFGNWSFLVLRSWIYKAFGLLYLGAVVGAAGNFCFRHPSVRQTFAWAGSFFRRRDRTTPPQKPETGRKSGLARWPDFIPGLRGGNGPVFPPHSLTILSVFFWLNAGLLYYASLTDLTCGVAGIGGWYVYTAVIPETAWLFLGLWLWYPPAWKRRVAGFLLGCFSLLDLYGLFFILVPYYTGITSHDAAGYMDAFKPFSHHARLLWEIPTRLAVGKPVFMGSVYFAVLTGVFLLLTLLSLVLAARWIALRPPPGELSGWRSTVTPQAGASSPAFSGPSLASGGDVP